MTSLAAIPTAALIAELLDRKTRRLATVANIAKVEINVLGSTDPRGTAKEVDRKLRETYERRDVSRVNHRNRAPGVR